MSVVVTNILGDGRFSRAGFANPPKADSYTNFRDATILRADGGPDDELSPFSATNSRFAGVVVAGHGKPTAR